MGLGINWLRPRAFNAVCLALLVISAGLPGCTRGYYRRQADQEAAALVYEKSNDPRWQQLYDFTIDMDPRSRYYDPYDPDRPPMPPDDPAAHELMHCVDQKEGWSHWHEDGDIQELENPFWRDYLAEYVPQTEDGNYVLDLQDSVRLAIIHLPTYQEQLETIYLSALDVSTERFRFDVQFFGGDDISQQHLGKLRTGGEANTLRNDIDLLATRRFSAAGQLLVNFANSFVWNFAGGNTDAISSLLSFNFVQPLLRAGGRAIALEQLTLAERGLLANLRAFQQYRQGFYTDLAVGDDGNVPRPRRRGGFLGGTGLTGFTGTGGGGFGGVGQATGFGRGGFGTGAAGTGGGTGGALGAGGGAGTVGGFIGLLQVQQELRNREDNLNLQLRTLALLEANQEAGLIGVDQVLQFQQSIETERANLLQSRNSLANSLENFKTGDLGLPADLPIELDDSFIRRFQLIDPRMSAVESAVSTLITDFGRLPQEPNLQDLQMMLTRVTEVRNQVAGQFQMVSDDLSQLDGVSEVREQKMTPEERDEFRDEKQGLEDTFKLLQTRFQDSADRLQELQSGLTPETREQSADRFVALTTELSNIVAELTLIQ
ncbi:MAG: hypothetical protein O7I42_27380, partial [Alphaproteobacteria bacterium]|nr:hypothetical protein [Alphaproteobacteria bacterium]